MERSLMIPVNGSFTNYEGFINCNGHEFGLRIGIRDQSGVGATGNPPYSYQSASQHARRESDVLVGSKYIIECDRSLHDLLRPHLPPLTKRIQNMTRLHEVVREIESTALLCLQEVMPQGLMTGDFSACDGAISCNSLNALPDPTYYSHLLQEIEAVGWENLMDISKDMSKLTFSITVGKGRRTLALTLCLPGNFPMSAPTCIADTPESFEFSWAAVQEECQGSARRAVAKPLMLIPSIIRQFQMFVDQFEDFWDMMEEIDKSTWVLQPKNPTYSSTMRRIAISKSCSVHLAVNWRNPRSVCDVKFLGSDNVVRPLYHNFNRRLHLWNMDDTLKTNLETVLGVTFPCRRTTNEQEYTTECGICYVFRLPKQGDQISSSSDYRATDGDKEHTPEQAADLDEDAVIPDYTCNNARCCRPYHKQCLEEWLSSLPTSRKSFQTIFGKCPYCQEPIAVTCGA